MVRKAMKDEQLSIFHPGLFFAGIALVIGAILAISFYVVNAIAPSVYDCWISLLAPLTNPIAYYIPSAKGIAEQLIEEGYDKRANIVKHSYSISTISTIFYIIVLTAYYSQSKARSACKEVYSKNVSKRKIIAAYFLLICFAMNLLIHFLNKKIYWNPVLKSERLSAYHISNQFITVNAFLLINIAVIILCLLTLKYSRKNQD